MMNEIWNKLAENDASIKQHRILSLFDDPERFDSFSVETDGAVLDFSKTSIDRSALSLFC